MATEQPTHTTNEQEHAEHASMSRKRIWEVFFYLLGITALEFIIALVLIPHGILNRGFGNFVYVMLTLLKAYYIVGYFMHLRFENRALVTSIVISLIFVIYLIILLLTEGSYLHLHMNQ